ncbi:putative membrane protein [Peribacillus deserti]|uniref:Membrane protein n=1 Tax=Peribacillus deserti TaxID=673318 RepID=A0ABS2QHE8_9BACI|nr:putative membrane protein [Peribacillus deserti]
MKTILKNFINGVLTIVPILVAGFVIYKSFTFLDSILGNLLRPLFKEDYIPGIGLLVTLILITLLGWLSTQFVTGKIIKLIDRLLEKIPIVKTIYSVVKDTVHSFLFEGCYGHSPWDSNEKYRFYHFRKS